MISFPSAMRYVVMNVKMCSLEPARLPHWFSSTIRGALGTELINNYCNLTETKCELCKKKCPAGILFAGDPHYTKEQVVSPYIISGDEFDGENLTFKITLFSNAVAAANDVVSVLKKGLSLGSGKKRFELVSVTDDETGDVIFDGAIQTEPEIKSFSCGPECSFETVSTVRVDFVTPYNCKTETDKFTFETLVRAMLRRIRSVYRLEGNELDIDYNSVIERASQVKTAEQSFQNRKTQRYSNRSSSKMNVTGFTGYAVYKGDLKEFMSFLRLTEVIHAGKLCVMGLGEIIVTVIE